MNPFIVLSFVPTGIVFIRNTDYNHAALIPGYLHVKYITVPSGGHQ